MVLWLAPTIKSQNKLEVNKLDFNVALMITMKGSLHKYPKYLYENVDQKKPVVFFCSYTQIWSKLLQH